MFRKIGIGIGIIGVVIVCVLILGRGPFVSIPKDAMLAQEYPGPNEQRVAQETSDLVLASIKKLYPNGKRMLRDAHPYAHGCVRGTFTVEAGLSESVRRGVFSEVRSFPVWIRFSNGTTKPDPDRTGGIRGMAIKLMDVPGKKIQDDEKLTQDFLVITHPVLPVGDPGEYLALFRAALAGKPMGYFFGGPPWKWKLTALRIVSAIRGKKIPSMLAIRYWSTVPFKLGDGAVKYSVRPCSVVPSEMPKDPGDHYLRETMVKELSQKGACFQFMVQPQTDPRKMPVEDPAVAWSETDSPFQVVAKITIPKQTFDTPAQNEFCENLTFNPWHSLPAHRPLGGINRVRKVAYDNVATFRLKQNGIPRTEPTGAEQF